MPYTKKGPLEILETEADMRCIKHFSLNTKAVLPSTAEAPPDTEASLRDTESALREKETAS
jgi:hypothetical protein